MDVCKSSEVCPFRCFMKKVSCSGAIVMTRRESNAVSCQIWTPPCRCARCLLAALSLAAGRALAGFTLDARYTEANGDMVADSPTDPAQPMDPARCSLPLPQWKILLTVVVSARVRCAII